jgi:hypothetical protein
MLPADGLAQPAMDRGRSLARDLLVEDGLDEGREGAAPVLLAKAAGPHRADDPFEHGIGPAQVADGASQGRRV